MSDEMVRVFCQHPDCRDIQKPARGKSPGLGYLCADHTLLCFAAKSPVELLDAPQPAQVAAPASGGETPHPAAPEACGTGARQA